ncbi:hypothetical protein [Endozoicomonas sp. YOMI1]|nr:hypothetical protein [Endozoicomonas sp. YOMI1]
MSRQCRESEIMALKTPQTMTTRPMPTPEVNEDHKEACSTV